MLKYARLHLREVATLARGRCELSRDPQTGLITKYREYWDKSPTEVVLTAFQRKPAR